ncbi:MAG TPA: kelch repeat-containing protein, partial [Blastocatellia bacterium]|nr:kelch repeat-containing protein [Blastocatellia bacterium]
MRRPDPQPKLGSIRTLTGNKLAAVPGKSILRRSDDSILGLPELNIERRGHTATELADGKILIVGGENKEGLVKRSESFDPDSESFVFSARLEMARGDHTATRVADGRVLVIGGRNRAPLESTEFFDPATASFEYGPSLNRARAGHSATVLGDGRVLIVGGDDQGTAEIFDPEKQTFSLLDERLNASRAFHSAVLLRNGKVLIAGGLAQDKTALRDGQLFDPRTLSFTLTRNSMRGARKRPTLRVLPDGKVQIIGGDAQRSMEMFNADEEYFTAHAHLLPGSNSIEEILRAQTRAGLFGEGAPEILRRSTSPLTAIGEMLDRSDYSLTDLPGTGRAVIAGGTKSGETLKSVVILSSSTATVTTDKTDYAPGETIVISGSGWQAEETVTLTLHRDNAAVDTILESVVDADGNFQNSEYLVQESDRDLSFLLTAAGQSSGYTAQTSFTDAGPTSPAAQAIPYLQDFSTLPHTGIGSSNYPAGWQGWTLATASSTSFRTNSPVADETLIAGSSASTSVGGVHNYNGKVGFLGTGSSGTDPSVCLAINTTGAANIVVSFDIMTIRNPYNGSTNTRINQIDLQYRIGTIGSFLSVSGNANGVYENNTTTQTGSGVTTPQNSQIKTFPLPGACDNQSNVQLRWVQRDQPSQAGARPSFAVDNISICALPGAANAIAGEGAVCQGQSGVSYSTPAIAAAASYSWAYSGTGATVNGTTNSITIDFSGTATSGNLTVKGINPCGDGALSSNFAISVSPNANAGAVSGTSPMCVGAIAVYSSSGDAGGSWSSANPAVATVNPATGSVTAASAGTTDITYTVTAGCGAPKSSFKTLTVDPDANAGTVSGTSPLCVGATAVYSSNGDAGGSWSSTNPAVASVNSSTGFVTALTAGTTDITYTVTAGCNAPKSSFKTLTVDPDANAGTVSGTSPLCVGATAVYSSNGD